LKMCCTTALHFADVADAGTGSSSRICLSSAPPGRVVEASRVPRVPRRRASPRRRSTRGYTPSPRWGEERTRGQIGCHVQPLGCLSEGNVTGGVVAEPAPRLATDVRALRAGGPALRRSGLRSRRKVVFQCQVRHNLRGYWGCD